MTERSIVRGTFKVERRIKASPAKVFAAFADPQVKAKWFGAPGGEVNDHDFRVGGWESSKGDIPGGGSYSYDANYRDIVPNNRIVYTYDMLMNGERISVSLATVELTADGSGTHMVVTEDGVFLDGLDTMEQRRDGTEQLMDALVKAVEA
jgi:uncharacterized protein YndB with AHSA1/START domain